MNTSNELALLDANVLVYADQEDDEHHVAAKALREEGRLGKRQLCVCPQVLNEYFSVVTNPRRVTKPRAPEMAMTEVGRYMASRHIRKVYPTLNILHRLQGLFQQYPVEGPLIFDLYLVATMLENGITKIYTYNTTDFAHISEIDVLKPEEIEFPKAEEEIGETERPENRDQESA